MHLKYRRSYSPLKLAGRHLSRYSTMASTLMFLPSLFVICYFHTCPSTTCSTLLDEHLGYITTHSFQSSLPFIILIVVDLFSALHRLPSSPSL
ncbi:hypothetical protein DFH28DRAFT_34507 [Melampsora americana]|nr:hypothetical protein DFH28DRAFT_34507 [Melampsora americana]